MRAVIRAFAVLAAVTTALAGAAAGEARGLAAPARFTSQPVIENPVAGEAAIVIADTVGDQPIALTCNWENGGTGTAPVWTTFASATACSGFALPSTVDKHWLRALVTASNSAGSQSEYTRAYLVGGEIVYHFNSGSLQELRAMYPDGTGDHEIGPSSTNWYYAQPAVSPDGSLIAFISDKDPNSDGRVGVVGVYVINSDGTNIRRVVVDASPDAHPQWSPDGKQIVYESAGAIYTVNVDGTGERQVYTPGDDPYNDHSPAFSTDGRSIVFSMRYEVTPGDPSQLWDAVEAGEPWNGYPWRFWQLARPQATTNCSPREPDINYSLPPEFVDQTCYLTPIYQLYSIPTTGGTPSELTIPQQFTNGETDPTHWTHVFASPLRSTRASHYSGQFVTLGGTPSPGLGNFNALEWHPVIVNAGGSFVSLPQHGDAGVAVAFSPDDTRILYDCDTPLACWGLHTVRLDGTGDFQIPNASITFGDADWGVLGTSQPTLTPLIFVPGIEGTTLYRNGTQVWPNALLAALDSSDSYLNVMSLAPDGTALDGGPQLTIGDIVGHVGLPGPFASADFYNVTLDHLEGAGYTLYQTLFPFPYDWRRSDSDNGRLLAGEIRAVLNQTGATTVDIMAHSQGGLVTLAMLHDNPSVATEIHRVVTLGTPVLGAPKALGVMDLAQPCLTTVPFVGCLYNPQAISQVSKTLPSNYELLPSPTLDSLEGPPLVWNGSPLAYLDWTNWVASLGSATLMANGENLHAQLDTYDPPVDLVRIYGDGLPTIRSFDRIDPPPCNGFQPCDTQPTYSVDYIGGDKTVPAPSAEVPETPQIHTVDLGPIEHMDLAKNSLPLDTALAILHAPDIPHAIRTYRTRVAAATGLSGIDLEAAGSTRLLVTDGTGNETGIDQANYPGLSYVEEIPGSSYIQAATTGSVFVTSNGAYHAVIHTTGAGPVRVTVRPYANDAIAGQATFYLPSVPSGAALTLDYTPSTALSDLRLQADLNGDGTVDETLTPSVTGGGGASDTTPPTTIGGANLSGPGTATVQLAADDGSGSGVATTWYELPGDTTPRVYTQPFTVPLGTTVRFRSIDLAGNLGTVGSLVADDVSDERAFAQQLSPPPPLQRTIGTATDVDWFTFAADGTSSYTVQLSGSPGSTLALYGADGSLVATAPSGPGVRKIDVTPSAGTYFVKVAAATGAKTPLPYVLDLHRQAAH